MKCSLISLQHFLIDKETKPNSEMGKPITDIDKIKY